MGPSLDGAVALVTGASVGIGAALARELAPRVGTLILTARRTEKLEALAMELRALGKLTVQVERCDLTDRADLEALIARIEARNGGVDILVNNAGRGDVGSYDVASWANKEQILELNIRAPSYLIQRLVPYMIARRRGGILNISSSVAFMPVFPGMSTYAASKHYLTALSETLRSELLPLGVSVTCACPGPVASEFLDVAGAAAGDRPPALLVQSAESCARDCVRGFEQGRGLVIPGTMNYVQAWLARLTPRFVTRSVMGVVGKAQRAKQTRLAAGNTRDSG